MTVEELEQAGEFEIPSVILRDISHLSEMGASVNIPLEFQVCDVLLLILGIKIVLDSDAEYIDFEQVDWGTVLFYLFPTIVK